MARKTMRMRLRVEGVQDVVQAMRKADDNIKKELRNLISEAAEIVFREADSRVPIGPTGRTRASLRIEVGEDDKGRFYANVVVGARPGDTTATSAFYVTFYELGTSRQPPDRKSTRLNSSHVKISYAVFCLKKKKQEKVSRV